MTLRDKEKSHLIEENTLRNRLQKVDKHKNIAILYKNDIIAIGTSDLLLHNSSRSFMGLMNNVIKEEVRGVTLYLKI